ncbi:hypothetical protein DL96DRAFT_1714987 [Flagelloscypha sp. PMI_526]|nr:hypothetical protein DL96DRAFT_1714987 [Flagelloscypha sp. PMI_526]
MQSHVYAAPSPQPASTYGQPWPSTSASPATHASRTQSRSARPSRISTPQPSAGSQTHLQLAPNQHGQFHPYQTQTRHSASPAPAVSRQLPGGGWPQFPYAAKKNMREQALWSTYSSRLRTGCSLLMQPIITAPTTNVVSIERQMPQPVASIVAERSSRRAAGKKVSYVDQGSSAEDEPEDNEDGGPDAGERVDSADEDFVASGGVRTSLRRAGYSRSGRSAAAAVPTMADEINQSYLGLEVPERLLKWRRIPEGGNGHGARELFGEVNLGGNQTPAPTRTSLVPITLSFNTPTHRIRDSFLWNIHENIVHPQGFAKVMCQDLELDASYVDIISAQIETQIEEHLEVASADIHQEAMQYEQSTGEKPECRVILSINVHIPPAQHLLDHIEWDLLSELTPEEFATTFCTEVGLGGESIPLITHALHEELLKHKKDAIDWGVLNPANTGPGAQQIRDKTGLGLNSASAWTKGGPGPRVLKSIWRDHAEAEEFQTRLQEMTEEEKERREVEGERFTRRLRRETSKFQSAGRSTRRR